MAASFRDGALLGLCLMAMVVVGSIGAEAKLTADFYDDSCPQIYDIVKAEIQAAVAAEARMAASLVRLHFHDCFVNGCDGSILLNSTNSFNNNSEQCSIANKNSIRGLNVIDTIKAQLEDACPQTVSCADIVAIASRDSAVEVGLTYEYAVLFGRRDSLTFSQKDANQFLPAPSWDYPQLVQNFSAVGLDETDLVALSGAHTIGRVKCAVVCFVLSTTGTTAGFNPYFANSNSEICQCPNATATGSNLLDLDVTTPDTFDNWYYLNLLVGEGILGSDQVLWSTPGGINQALVAQYASDQDAFEKQFALSSIKMGNIKPLTGDEGEIRVKCGVINDATSSGSAASLIASQ